MGPIYAIEIKKRDFELIAVLNGGVTPLIEKKKTFFVFEIEGGETVNPTIVTQKELANDYDIVGNSPLFLRLKQVKKV